MLVYFIYPETANVRLEDMNSIFGDATTLAATPQTLAEAESLFSRSPVPSLRLGDDTGVGGPQDANIPDLDIDPPTVGVDENGKPMYTKAKDSESGSISEGLGGWISGLVNKGKGDDADGASGKYRRVGQDEE